MKQSDKDYKESLGIWIKESEFLIEENTISIKYHKDMCKIYMCKSKLLEQQNRVTEKQIEDAKKIIDKLEKKSIIPKVIKSQKARTPPEKPKGRTVKGAKRLKIILPE